MQIHTKRNINIYISQAKFLDFKIQNCIATADLRFPIKLEALQQAHGQFSSYEPELFPGLVYRMVRPRVVLLIFVNGKIVFTGKFLSLFHKFRYLLCICMVLGFCNENCLDFL